jgi:shikimate dehydrogenase
MTKHVGLIGYPLKHSVSAAFQQAALDYYGRDIRYNVWETEPGKLEAAVERLRQPEVLGANVTVPHKETIIPLLDKVESPADQIGAVNTIIKVRGKLIGHNTDALGFIRALREDTGFDPHGKQVVILGAGGAAHAVSFILMKSGAANLTIINEYLNIAESLSLNLTANLDEGQTVSALPWEERSFQQALSTCNLLVNCTTVGMKHGKNEGQSPVDAKFLTKDMMVCDLVYNPLETPLLKMTAAAGGRTLAGLPMLIYQGAAAFEMWTGNEPPIQVMFKAARAALEV